MHFNFDFSAGQILWTLTFAALLVLLVVLLGRDRVRRFPWFTASIALMALDMLASRLLYATCAPTVSSEIFLVWPIWPRSSLCSSWWRLARRAFAGAGRRAGSWARWRCWPWAEWCWCCGDRGLREDAHGCLGTCGLAADAARAQKADSARQCAVHPAWPAVVLFGRRFKAGWHSHTQQISIGLSTAALSQLACAASCR